MRHWDVSLAVAVVALLPACGGAVAPAIGDGDGSGSGDGNARNDGSGSSAGGSSNAKSPSEGSTGFVTCGASKCAVSGGRSGARGPYCCIEEASAGGPRASCKDDVPTACSGHRLACDEAADCKDGNVCCTEPGGALVTGCRPTCITGAPRIQVCTTDGECENGGPCRSYDCGDGVRALRFCEKPDGCK